MTTTPNATCITFKASLSDVLKAFHVHSRANVSEQLVDPSDPRAITASGAVVRRMFIDADHYKISGYAPDGSDVLQSLAAINREGGSR